MNRRTKGFVVTLLAVAVIAVIAVPLFLKARARSQRNACLNNLRQMDCVLYCCNPRSENLAEGDTMDPKTCFQYVKGGTIPVCPAGGKYIVSYVVGGPGPKCSIHGGLLHDGKDEQRLHPGVRRKNETKEQYEARMVELEKESKDRAQPQTR
jgi:hypothetical protein